MVSQTIAATPPLLSVEMAYCSPKTGLTRGRRRKNLPLNAIALQGASHEIASQRPSQSRFLSEALDHVTPIHLPLRLSPTGVRFSLEGNTLGCVLLSLGHSLRWDTLVLCTRPPPSSSATKIKGGGSTEGSRDLNHLIEIMGARQSRERGG